MRAFPKISIFLLLGLSLGCGKQSPSQGFNSQQNEKSYEVLTVDNEFSFSPTKKYLIFSNGKSGAPTMLGPKFFAFSDHQSLKFNKENSLIESIEMSKIKTEWFLWDQFSKPETFFEDRKKRFHFNSALQIQLESSQNFYDLPEFPKSDGYHFSLNLVLNETFLKNNILHETGNSLKISGKGCEPFVDNEEDSNLKNNFSGCFFNISEMMAWTTEKTSKKPIRYFLFNRDLKSCSFELNLNEIEKKCRFKDEFLCSDETSEVHKVEFPYKSSKSKVVLKIKCMNEKNEILFKSRFIQNGTTL